MNLSSVSIIIPCRNEEKLIGKCLDSIISQDYPKENLEVFVVDGASEDDTKNIVSDYSKKLHSIKIINNPKKFTPFGLNIGIKAAKGEIILRMDAHAGYENNYISKCVKYLKEYNADNVGGIIKTLPIENTLIAKAIAVSLSNFFGAGDSYFRIGSKKIREVDTVFGGCYRKEVFEKVGFFNEKLIRSQDIEFNRRLKKSGGKIFLIPDVVAYYYPKSTLREFLSHNFTDGFWTIYPLKFGIRFFSFRHLFPMMFLVSLIFLPLLYFFLQPFIYIFLFLIIFYIFFDILFSVIAAEKENNLKLLLVLPLVFAIRHFGYGTGSVYGFLKIL